MKMFFEMTQEEKKASGEQCEFCGGWNGGEAWWYDPCCDRNLLKHREKQLADIKFLKWMNQAYNESLGVKA